MRIPQRGETRTARGVVVRARLPGERPATRRTPATRAYDAPRIAAIKFDPGQATTASAEQVEVRVDSPRKENGGCGGAPVPLGAHDVALRIWAAVGKPRAADVVGDTLEERIIDAVRQALGRRAAAALRADPSTSLVSLATAQRTQGNG